MRILLAAVAALALCGTANAEPVAIEPIAFTPTYMEKLEDDYGVREAQALAAMVDRSLRDALTRAGATVDDSAGLRIETTIHDARPNRPTFQQLSDNPSLDFGNSFGVGGAKLHGFVRGPDGQILGEVTYRWYESDISRVMGYSAWHDARRAIRSYANRVADVVAEHEG